MVRNYDIEVESLSDAERTPSRAGRVFPIVGFWGHDGYNEYRLPDAAQYHRQHQRGDEDHDNNVHLRPHLYLIAIT
jgi:hypothetical protein